MNESKETRQERQAQKQESNKTKQKIKHGRRKKRRNERERQAKEKERGTLKNKPMYPSFRKNRFVLFSKQKQTIKNQTPKTPPKRPSKPKTSQNREGLGPSEMAPKNTQNNNTTNPTCPNQKHTSVQIWAHKPKRVQ